MAGKGALNFGKSKAKLLLRRTKKSSLVMLQVVMKQRRSFRNSRLPKDPKRFEK